MSKLQNSEKKKKSFWNSAGGRFRGKGCLAQRPIALIALSLLLAWKMAWFSLGRKAKLFAGPLQMLSELESNQQSVLKGA